MAKINIGSYTVGAVQTNVYYLHLEDSSETILVDPADYGNELVDALEGKGLALAGILLTHGHYDHIRGVKEVVDRTGVKVYASERERSVLSDACLNLSADDGRPVVVKPDVLLRDQECIEIGGITFRCISTPGHTEGSCCYYAEGSVQSILLSGDTLFEESVGRTDFPTGSMSQLVRSVREKLYLLPEDTVVYPGHGGITTIGHEKKYNCVVPA